MSDIISITEQYISPRVLPREQASAWIKWKKGVSIDKLVLRYEADVDIFRLFNIDEEVFETKDEWNGKVVIPKEMIQIDGFFGFTTFYTMIPDKERKISYEIDVISDDKTQTIHLENTVTRPMVEVVSYSPEQIHISKTPLPLQPLSMKLKSAGMASLHNLTYFIDFISSDKLKVEIVTMKKPISKEMSLKNEQLTSQKISINGKGNGLIRIGAQYTDDYNTKYEDILKEIPIIVEEEQRRTIPISEQIEKQETALLTISK